MSRTRTKAGAENPEKEKKKKTKKAKVASIGGQAVMEGVMMRGVSSMAIAVRDEEGIIRVESSRFKPAKKRNIFFRLPVIRGVVNFCQSMATGVTTLTKSAEVYGEQEPSKAEKWLAEKLHVNVMSVIIGIGMILGLALAIGLFFILPNLITVNLFKDVFGWEFSTIVTNLIEGGVRLLIFIAYLLLVSILKDIRRTFMYHGAEHRVISCFERGYEMTVENAQKCSTLHNRCGTTFLFFVMLMSIIVFSIFDGVMQACGVTVFQTNTFFRILAKIALLPLVAGLSYELLKLLAKSDFFLLYPLKAPGLLLQKITTRKPTDDMVEVALKAFMTVAELDADPSLATVSFKKPRKPKELHAEIVERLKSVTDCPEADADWIFCAALGVKRDQIFEKTNLPISKADAVEEYVRERLTGRPLQYVLGETEFYGYKIAVDERVLIPRFDTEILAEAVIKRVRPDTLILDMATGSGAVGIAVQKQTGARIVASDVSRDALQVARANSRANNTDIEFVESDLFENLIGRQFDVIVCNPPYIKSADIETLNREVRQFEPALALDGGEDGLAFYRRIAADAASHIREGGSLFLEVGAGQADDVAAMFPGETTEKIKDLNGIERVVRVDYSPS